MKPFLLLFLLFSVASHNAKAAIIYAKSSGNWSSPSTWSLDRTPENDDDVIIPFGRTVYFQNTPYSKTNISARPTLHIDIWGTLDFSNAGNDKLYLDVGSSIEIHLLARIQTTSSSSEIIAIYNGSEDNTVWTGSPATVWGPKSANGSSNGFQNALLPIKLDFFEVTRADEKTAKLSWQTSEETNTSHFEIERFNITSNKWNVVATVRAAGNSSQIINYYSYCPLIDGPNQFRLKQVDIDGKYTYSPIRNLNLSLTEVTVEYSKTTKSFLLHDKTQSKYQVMFYTGSGTLIQTKLVSSGQVFKLNRELQGLIIVAVYKDNTFQHSRKFIL